MLKILKEGDIINTSVSNNNPTTNQTSTGAFLNFFNEEEDKIKASFSRMVIGNGESN